mmetsp:Transcript_3936/g.5513  ORF Transcript_3936/g.5513 Transcript_3936/m.5513 type:complete len:153 (-) Transcript_3936:1687-2145(-)
MSERCEDAMDVEGNSDQFVSEYEQLRIDDRIKENNAYLESLGLGNEKNLIEEEKKETSGVKKHLNKQEKLLSDCQKLLEDMKTSDDTDAKRQVDEFCLDIEDNMSLLRKAEKSSQEEQDRVDELLNRSQAILLQCDSVSYFFINFFFVYLYY